jgi:hypothetical protein
MESSGTEWVMPGGQVRGEPRPVTGKTSPPSHHARRRTLSRAQIAQSLTANVLEFTAARESGPIPRIVGHEPPLGSEACFFVERAVFDKRGDNDCYDVSPRRGFLQDVRAVPITARFGATRT